MRFIGAADTRAALPFGALIDALHGLFKEGCEVPLRHTHLLKGSAGEGSVLIMPAWRADKHLGIKTVSVFPGNAERGLPALFSTYVLYDAQTGEPLAQMDGNEITARRTAAASALAARYLARADAKRLLVVGAGTVAALLAPAYREVLPIEQVEVWARDAAKAEALVLSLTEQGIAAKAVLDLAGAAARADVVSCATFATQPLIRGAWLQAGAHLDLIGSFTPAMREADEACFAGASVFVDTPEAVQKSGDLIVPISLGVIAASDVRGTLAALCRGDVPGRQTATERTVFKSVGNALEDLAAATLVWQATHAAGE